jgi:hypothetical protein
MLARQIVLAIAHGNAYDIDNMHGRVKDLIDQSLRRDAKDVILTRENGFELRAYLQLLSAAQRYRRQLDRAPVDLLRTVAKSDAAGSLGAPRITEQVLIWPIQHRRMTDRNGLRYPSDLTDAEWELIQGLIPPIKFRGRKRKVNMREVLNGILYVLSTGCKWNALPKDLPLKSAVLRYFHRWSRDGALEQIHHKLYG